MVAQALWWVDHVAHEATLFAGIGLLIGGIDDLLVDFCFVAGWLMRRGTAPLTLATLPAPAMPGRLIVFVPAWDEAAVIGEMLAAALVRYDHHDYAIYVGLYPNDPATIAAVAAVAQVDPRVRPVVGDVAGPTTKADCLNTIWAALIADERHAGIRAKAIVLHDAEDVVHPAELRVFDSLIEGRTVVQLPVLPLIAPGSRLVSGQNLTMAELRRFCRLSRENRLKRYQILARQGKTRKPTGGARPKSNGGTSPRFSACYPMFYPWSPTRPRKSARDRPCARSARRPRAIPPRAV